VPFPALRRVDVRRGEHRSGARIAAGIILGGAAGLILGAYAGAIDCHDGCPGDFGGLPGGLLGATIGLAGGATAGGIAGGRRTAKWEAVTLRR
jgi:hypothetical protein